MHGFFLWVHLAPGQWVHWAVIGQASLFFPICVLATKNRAFASSSSFFSFFWPAMPKSKAGQRAILFLFAPWLSLYLCPVF